jgi:hypothetical protein
MLVWNLRTRQSQTRLRNGQNLLECKDFLQLQTGKNRSKNTPSLLKIQGTGLCSCGLLYCSTVRFLSRNRISSQRTRHYCFWQPLFLVFPLYFARNTEPNIFFFEKFPLKLWQPWILFCLSFQTCWDFNVRVKSNRDQAPPPGQPPGNLTLEKIIGQMPDQTGRNHSQMPCYRGSPGSRILAKIKLNKYFKIKKNEK